MMPSMIKLFMVLLTVTVACLGWIAGKFESRSFLTLLVVLVAATLLAFIMLNIYERKLEERKRTQRESTPREGPEREAGKVKRSEGTFSLRKKKAGLTWGGGNIKASEATRGTKRKFLGK